MNDKLWLTLVAACRWLDKAAIVLPGELTPNVAEEEDNNNNNIAFVPDPWRLCTVTQVEEVKWLVRIVPIWLCTILYTTAYTQVFSLFVIQGSNMDTRIGGFFDIPPASLYAVDCVSVVLCIAAYEYGVQPLARSRHPEGLSALQRIGIGMPIVALAMLEAGLLEMLRLRKLEAGGANLSVLWQLPLYVTTGVSETFTYIGQMHFFYDQAPDAVRSIGSALTPASVALGNYANALLLLAVARLSGSPGWIPDSGSIDSGHLDYFFFTLAALALANFGLFSAVAACYRSTERRGVSAVPPAS
jgi:peptide/histidine transporter 3/4